MTDIEERGLFIRGEFVPASSGATSPFSNPHNGEVFTRVAEAGEAAVNESSDAARDAFGGPWGPLPPKEQGKVLLKWARLIQGEAEAIAQIEAKNTGHPIRDVRR